MFQIILSQEIEILTDIPKNLTGDKVINQYLKSIGGEKNIKNVKTLEKKSIIEIEGISKEIIINAQVLYKQPNLYASVLEMSNIGQIQSTKYDGQNCIITRKNNTQTIEQKLEGKLLEEKLKEFIPFPLLEEKNNNSNFKIEAIHKIREYPISEKGEKIYNQELYKVSINENPKKLFFDAANGYLVKIEDKIKGKTEKIIEYKNYKKVDNITFPFLIEETIKSEFGEQKTITRVTEIIINQELELNQFQ